MANLQFLKNRGRWRIRYRATNRKTHQVLAGSKCFFEKAPAVRFYGNVEEQERAWRAGEPMPGEYVTEAAGQFYQYCTRHTKRTQQHYRYVLEKFLVGLPKDIVKIQQIEPHHIEEFIYRMKDRHLLNRTCNANLTVIKSFFKFCNWRYGVGNPASMVTMLKEDPPRVRFLNVEEYHKLLDTTNQTARDRLIFLANTGLRASEFGGLTPESFVLGRTAIIIKGKGRKQRTVPLNQAAREVVPRLKIASKNGLWLQFKRVAKEAGIPCFGPHALRHLFATQLILRGVPLVIVSRLLGHSSTRTTEQCYLHILSADLQHATDCLSSL